MADNIIKTEFNLKFSAYIQLTDFREANHFYNYHLHADIQAVITNAIYTFQFEDMEARQEAQSDLLFHFLLQRQHIRESKIKNVYNFLFTMFRNKMYDLYRTNEVKRKRNELLIDLRDSHPDPYYEMVID